MSAKTQRLLDRLNSDGYLSIGMLGFGCGTANKLESAGYGVVHTFTDVRGRWRGCLVRNGLRLEDTDLFQEWGRKS